MVRANDLVCVEVPALDGAGPRPQEKQVRVAVGHDEPADRVDVARQRQL